MSHVRFDDIPCAKEHFQEEFSKWSSGNEEIDRQIKAAQLDSVTFEWVPPEDIHDMELIDESDTGKVYSAVWLNGPIKNWNVTNRKFNRSGNVTVCLKSLDNLGNINEMFNQVIFLDFIL